MTKPGIKREPAVQLREVLADLHVHVGYVGTRPIKIPASSDLTLGNILQKCRDLGIRLVGLADCNARLVRDEIEGWITRGALIQLSGGGLLWENTVTLIPAAEVEASEGGPRKPGRPVRRSHHMIYFHSLERIDEFNRLWQEARMDGRINASSIMEIADRVDGLFIPAHIFTPHKGLLGCSADKTDEVFQSRDMIPAVEIGLSADSEMADRLSEMENRAFFSNSDAHSLKKIGREYNSLLLGEADLNELQKVVRKEAGRRIAANFGMLPALGKYYRSCCRDCGVISKLPSPVLACEECGSSRVDMGVLDRVEMIADRDISKHPPHRPPYHYLIPLEVFPSIGPKTAARLLEEYGSEKNVLWTADEDELKKIVGSRTASLIICARNGEIEVSPGGGGKFGKIDRARQ